MKITKPAINLRERLKQFINWEQVVDKLSSQGVKTVSVEADHMSVNQTQGALSGPSDNVLDIFVYDTTRDSDGGAWRKRTSHTSWYNETLNTSVRGSRREFPQVAVIVTTQGQLTIYDADQPDLPMWMVFEGVDGWGSGIVFSNIKQPAGQLAAINGTIVFGDEQAFGFIEVNFISELARSYTSGTGSYGGTSDAPLVNRNTETRWRNNGYTLPDRNNSAVDLEHNVRVTSVAATVLPGAPIDRETSLPRPTLAVGKSGYADLETTSTQRGGLEIIKHHLNVYNEPYNVVRWSMDVPNSSTYYYEMVRNMHFDGEILYFTTDAPANLKSGTGTAQRALCRLNVNKMDHDLPHNFYYLSKLPETFINATGVTGNPESSTFPYNQLATYQSYVTDMDHEAMATDLGLIRYFDQFPEARDAYHSGGICYVDNRHVSGWLCNDWKFSLCSDTKPGIIGDPGEIDLMQGMGDNPDVTNFTAQNAVISNDTTGVDKWIMIVDDGANAGGMSAATIDVTTEIGKSYTVFFDKVSTTTNFHFSVFSAGWAADAGDVLSQAGGTIPGRDSATFVATSTTSTLAFAVGDNGEARYDNMKMIETEHSTELVTNQHFKSNITTTDQVYNGGWTQGSGGVISNSGLAGIDSSIKITSGGGTTARAITRVKTTPGETYVFSARAVERTASQYKIMVRSGVDIEDGSTASGVTQSVSFVAVEEETMLELYAPGAAGTYAVYNNPSCKPAIADGAGNVHKDTTMLRTIPAYVENGHVERRPVAPGAELMGFYFPNMNTTRNGRFRTPSRSDLIIGTKDFYVTSWVFAQPDGDLNIQQLPYNGGNAEGWRVVLSNGADDVYIVNGDFSSYKVFSNKAPVNQWYHFAAVRTYGHNWTIFIDGVKHGSTATLASEDHTYTNGNYSIVINGDQNNALALTRVGTGRLTGEHIRKMYDDERYLFNPGAKCSLHGDDHVANCVAYDPSTNLTHVGTDSGTSTFNGFVRVDQSSQPADHIAAAAGVVLKS